MASSSGQPPHEERFKSVMEGLTKVLYGYFQNLYSRNITTIQPNTILLAQGFVEAYDAVAVLENYVNYSHDYWSKIAEKDESFMVENCHQIFRDLPSSNPDELIGTFKTLYTSRIFIDKSKNDEEIVVNVGDPRYDQGHDVLTVNEKDALWSFFTAMTKISIKYIHDKREPFVKSKEVDGQITEVLRYKCKAFPEIKKLQNTAKQFGLTLEWRS